MAVLVRSIPLHRITTTNSDAFTVPKSLFVSVHSTPLFLISRFHLQNPNFPSPRYLRRRLAPPLRSRPGLCLAGKPGRPSLESEPNPEHSRRTVFESSLSKFQDRVQIFFAVLFWMSLFFWTCAWDDRNRPNKGSRFRR